MRSGPAKTAPRQQRGQRMRAIAARRRGMETRGMSRGVTGAPGPVRLPPDLALDVLGLVFPIGGPEVRGEVLPAAIGEEADDVLFAFEAFGGLDGGADDGAAA